LCWSDFSAFFSGESEVQEGIASASRTGGGVLFPFLTLHFGCLLHYFQLYSCWVNGNF